MKYKIRTLRHISWGLTIAFFVFISASGAVRIGNDFKCAPNLVTSKTKEGSKTYAYCFLGNVNHNGTNVTAGLAILTPNNELRKIMNVTVTTKSVTEIKSRGIKESRWTKIEAGDKFPESISKWNLPRFGITTPKGTCSDEIVAQCFCTVERPDAGSQTHVSKLQRIMVEMTPRVSITDTTPYIDNWSNGTNERNWIGARCVATRPIASNWSEIQWVIHRSKGYKEIVTSDDDRVYLNERRTFSHYVDQNPGVLTSECLYQGYISSINFPATYRDHNLILECRLVLPSSDEKVKDQWLRTVSAKTSTKPLKVYSKVSKENTQVKLLETGKDETYRCISEAYPPPTYQWFESGRQDRLLNTSTGPQPGYLKRSKSAVGIICKVSNKFDGKVVGVEVTYDANADDTPETAASIIEDLGENTLKIPAALFATGAVVGLAILVFALIKEKRDHRAYLEAWGELEEKRRSLNEDHIRSSIELASRRTVSSEKDFELAPEII